MEEILEEILKDALNKEIARELILQKHRDVDDARFEESFKLAKGNGWNGWDAAVLYDLIKISKEIK